MRERDQGPPSAPGEITLEDVFECACGMGRVTAEFLDVRGQSIREASQKESLSEEEKLHLNAMTHSYKQLVGPSPSGLLNNAFKFFQLLFKEEEKGSLFNDAQKRMEDGFNEYGKRHPSFENPPFLKEEGQCQGAMIEAYAKELLWMELKHMARMKKMVEKQLGNHSWVGEVYGKWVKQMQANRQNALMKDLGLSVAAADLMIKDVDARLKAEEAGEACEDRSSVAPPAQRTQGINLEQNPVGLFGKVPPGLA